MQHTEVKVLFFATLLPQPHTPDEQSGYGCGRLQDCCVLLSFRISSSTLKSKTQETHADLKTCWLVFV